MTKEEMKQDFINMRIKHNKELELNQHGERTVSHWERNYGLGEDYKRVEVVEKCTPFRLKEKPLNENPNLMLVEYNNGLGHMVIDLDNLNKLSKSQQNKIFKL